ncbi:TRAF-type zinc finger domain-containing protein 1-like [Planoprotostelium fungivorum]|uniref:TRAF-type zinc finger domain-containing protein 1-like n=1 Tax=Planoprotostelium fungivorum TaxID=1890364 RepID=A0A2P6NL52_9EUKA|nr:TRAF-type zinc finger domain-containing protein 1-like [Planoprotostelium fungivorum]
MPTFHLFLFNNTASYIMPLCENCGKDIEGNFTVHQLHCLRNIVKCPVCSDAVPSKQLDEHLTSHTEVTCECGEKMTKPLLEEHKESECPLQMLTICPFCHLHCPNRDRESHEDYCGNRTDVCESCNKFVRLREMSMHIETGCFYPVDASPKRSTIMTFSLLAEGQIPCEICDQMLYPNEVATHQESCLNDEKADEELEVLEAELAELRSKKEKKKTKRQRSISKPKFA